MQEARNSTSQSWLNLAVSKTSHPTGPGTNDWFFYRLEMTLTVNGTSYWGDYPGLGSDGQAVYVTFNMFDFPITTNSALLDSQIIILNKADLNRGVLNFRRVFAPDGISGTLVPASVIGGNNPGNKAYFVQVSLPTFIAVWALTDPLGSPVLLPPFQLPVPPNGGLPGGGAPQAGTTNLLDTLGEEFKAQGNAFWLDGAIWFSYTGGVPLGSEARVYYYEVNTHKDRKSTRLNSSHRT